MLVVVIAAAALAAHRDAFRALEDTTFQRLQQEQDLDSDPTAFAQDGDGFMWIGTESGLARFDGYHLRLYPRDGRKPNSLPDASINVLFTDTRSRLWIGTSSAGFVRYDSKLDGFHRYALRSQADADVLAMADDGTDGLWIGTIGGLEHLASDDRTLTYPVLSAKFDHNGNNDAVRALLLDGHRTLWVGTNAGLFQKPAGAARFAPVAVASGGPAVAVVALCEDSGGNVWIGTDGNGAFRFDRKTRHVAAVQQSRPAAFKLDASYVPTIAQARPGEMWLGTGGDGIVIVNTADMRTRNIRHDARLSSGLSDNFVRSIFRDRERRLWVLATPSFGVRNGDQSAISTLLGGTGRANSISDGNVEALTTTPSGRIWLGFTSNGVAVIDPQTARITSIRPEPERIEAGLPRQAIDALAPAPDGGVFIGTESGLYWADRRAKRVRRMHIPSRLPTTGAISLFSQEDELWIGGAGLWGVKINSAGTPRLVTHLTGHQLSDTRVTVIIRGAAHTLWVGTQSGLQHFDPATKRIDHLRVDPNSSSALPSGEIATLLLDRRGRLWVGAAGGGITIIDNPDVAARRHFHHLMKPQGLPHNNIDALLSDGAGNVWASTDSGIARIDSSTLEVRAFHRADGVEVQNYWAVSAARTRHDLLLFGGAGGLTVIRPTLIRTTRFHAPIVITDILIAGKSVISSSFNSYDAKVLRILPSSKSFSVEFSRLSYAEPQESRYQYRLDGFDADWIESSAVRRVATYTNLSPGKYTLRLRGASRIGGWTERVLTVEVVPAWYQTWWSYSLAAIAALAVIGSLIHLRTTLLRRRQYQLETEVRRQTAELRDSRQQLETLAYSDLLTGLPNRRMYHDECRKAIARAISERGNFVLLLIDLDRFKHINDTFGHDAGDALLVEAARRFTASVRKSDIVARLGGDEFAVLLGDCAYDVVDELCSRIIASVGVAIVFSGQQLDTSASIGVAIFPDDGQTENSLYKAADLALYAAKNAGRKTWRWYQSSTTSH